MSMLYQAEGEGETAAADVAACQRVMQCLQRFYPDHPWLIGSDLFSGMIHFRLLYDGNRPADPKGYGYMLKLSTVEGPDAERRIKQGGGECLERFRLERGPASEKSALKAAENGIDLTGMIRKSKYSDERYAARRATRSVRLRAGPTVELRRRQRLRQKHLKSG